MLTLRDAGNGFPSLRAFFHLHCKMNEIVSSGTPSRALNDCAVMNKKNVIGSQRITAATERAMAGPTFLSVPRLGLGKNPGKLAGPSLAVKEKTHTAKAKHCA